jgi:hypothetical protein
MTINQCSLLECMIVSRTTPGTQEPWGNLKPAAMNCGVNGQCVRWWSRNRTIGGKKRGESNGAMAVSEGLGLRIRHWTHLVSSLRRNDPAASTTTILCSFSPSDSLNIFFVQSCDQLGYFEGNP